jgi:hypothetical protein
VYCFVREHASLLDGYASLAKAALVYTHENFSEIRDAAVKLAQANTPYAIIVAGDEELPAPLTAETFAQYDYLIEGPSGKAGEILEKSGTRSVKWGGLAELPNPIKEQVSVDGSDSVRVSIRYKPDDSAASIVCHLLNQNYDVERDDVKPVDVRVTLSKGLIGKAKGNADVYDAILHTPKHLPVRLPAVKSSDDISFEVKALGLWAIVELGCVDEFGKK